MERTSALKHRDLIKNTGTAILLCLYALATMGVI